MPASAHTEKDGTFTNTQRLIQWHSKAVEPKGDCRSELWFYFHLGRRIKEKLAAIRRPARRPRATAVGLPDARRARGAGRGGGARGDRRLRGRDAGAARRLPEAEGRRLDGVRLLDLLRRLQGRRQPGGAQEAALGADYVAAEWAWAWPDNRRSSTTAPPRTRRGTRGRSARSTSGGTAASGPASTRRTSRRRSRPDYDPPKGAEAQDAIKGDHPFVMQADGRSWLFVPQGLMDGPFPAHYEPQESPFDNPLYAQRANPARQQNPELEEDPYNPVPASRARALPVRRHDVPADRAPHGGRHVAVCELPRRAAARDVLRGSPELAEEAGLEHGGWATIYTTRSAIEARVLVTDESGR